MGGTFGGNLWEGVVAHDETSDQIMPRKGELYKDIFQ